MKAADQAALEPTNRNTLCITPGISVDYLVREGEAQNTAPLFRAPDTTCNLTCKTAEMARTPAVSPTAITSPLEHVEKRGFTRRNPGCGDRRRAESVLTPGEDGLVRRVSAPMKKRLKQVPQHMDPGIPVTAGKVEAGIQPRLSEDKGDG